MTIEAQDNHTLWIRCGSGTGDVIGIQFDPNTGNLMIECFDFRQDAAVDPLCSLTIPAAEVLALGQILIAMATRQLRHIPDPDPEFDT